MKTKMHLLAGTAAALALLAGTQALAEAHMNLADEQVFTYSEISDAPSIDPGLVEDVHGSDIARDLFEGLMNQDPQGNLIPGVATGYEASDDGMTYTFTLRDNAKWSNGDPVTAQDFVYAWQRAASPELASPYSWYLSLMAIENVDAVIEGEMAPSELGVTAVDDYTLEVRLTQPLPYFPQMVTHATTFPIHQATVEAHGDAWTQPGNMVSNGAYVLSEWVPQERMVRTKNDQYWDAENTVLEEVVTLIIADENQALTRYLAGELDKVGVPAGQFPRLSEEYPDQATSVPSLCSYYYMFNLRDTGPEWAKDVNVRQALNLTIDRDVIVENVLAGGQYPAYTFTPGATAGFEVPSVEIAGMSMEDRIAKAQELMAAAGYGEDNPLTVNLVYNTSDSHRSIAVAISQMWKQALGVDTELANQEWQTFLEARSNGDYDVARGGWCGDYNEASTFLDLMESGSGYNDSKFVNEEVDQILAEAKTAEDTTPLYTRVEEIIAEEVPIMPIYHYTSVFMLNPNVKGWPYENVQTTWYSKDLYITADE